MAEKQEGIGAAKPQKPNDKRSFWEWLDRLLTRIPEALSEISLDIADGVAQLVDKMMKGTQKIAKMSSKFAMKAILVAAVLTGFAKKETEAAKDNEPPKATLTVGTLGVKVMKAKINNGDKSTDFDANMIYAQAAKEIVGKVVPEKDQDKAFEENPLGIGKGAKSATGVDAHKSNADLLRDGSKPTKEEDKDSGKGSPLAAAAVAVLGAAALSAAAGKRKREEKGGNDDLKAQKMTVVDMAAKAGRGPSKE